jgi:hypothetical protein
VRSLLHFHEDSFTAKDFIVNQDINAVLSGFNDMASLESEQEAKGREIEPARREDWILLHSVNKLGARRLGLGFDFKL